MFTPEGLIYLSLTVTGSWELTMAVTAADPTPVATVATILCVVSVVFAARCFVSATTLLALISAKLAWLLVDVEAYKSGCSGGYCFVVTDIRNSNEFLDQSKAQQWCRSNKTQLAEIENIDIQNTLVNFLRGASLNGWNVMTNGKRSGSSWIRLNGNGIGGIRVYEQIDASYAYGYLKSTTFGFDLSASTPIYNKGGYICTGLSDCSGGTTINGQCYRSFTETLSWYDARNRCLVGGGDLASFDYITTNAGFNALNSSWINASNSYWIGIRREWWIWQNSNSDVKYSEWITGHPINDVGRDNSDCLCMSTTQWKWIECGCNQQLPFVCISDNNSITSSTTTTSTKTTTTTTPTTTSTTTSPTTRSTTSTGRPSATVSSTTSISAPSVASESGGVPTPTIPSNFTPTGNDTVNEQSMGLSQEAVIGIGVGVGVGGALVIIALIAAVILLCRKRCSLRCPQRKKTNAKGQPPDILMKDGIENPYARVVSSSPEWNDTDTNAYENSSQTPTVYAELGFCTEPRIHRPGSVIIVPGKTKPATLPRPPNNNDATNHFNVGGDLYAEVTKA